MDLGDEEIEWAVRVVLPVMGEEVIEENVDDDAGEASSFRREEIVWRRGKTAMAVGELIDGAVEDDSVDDLIRKLLSEALGSTSHEVTEKRAHAGGVGISSEMKVSEKVQGLWDRDRA